jgi:hypothetical protein
MTRLLKILVFAAVFVAALFIGHQNATASYWPGTEQPQLEAKLPTHVRVYCATQNVPGADGWTWLTVPEIYLTPEVCAELADGNFAYAYMVLYHEWWHQAFHTTNESNTNTGALTIYRYMLRHYWGFDAYKAQTFYDSVWASFVPRFAPGYEITSLQNSEDPLIVDGF